MTKTLEISFALKNAYRVNGILYSIKQIPIIRKLLPDSVYQVEGLKVFANVLSMLWEVISAFGGKLIYFALMLFGATRIYDLENKGALFLHILLFLTITGAVDNTYMFNPTRDKYYAMILMRMDAKKYTLVNYGYAMMKVLTGFLLFGLIFGLLSGVPFWACLLIPLFVSGLKAAAAALSLLDYEKRGVVPNENKLGVLKWVLMFGCLGAAYGLPFFGIVVPIWLSAAVMLLSAAAGALSVRKILAFDDYRAVYKELLTANMGQVEAAKAAAKTQSQKVISADVSITSSKKGFEFLNELFIKRHRKILWKSSQKISFIALCAAAVAIAAVLLFPEAAADANEIPLRFLPYFTFIMYIINRGTGFTQALFMNCDHSLLTYSFYKNPKFVLHLFWIRLKEIIKINLPPAVIIGGGLAGVLYASGGTDDPVNYVVIFVSIICMSVFFSMHYLTIYYLLQPYNAGTELKSGTYRIVMYVTYFVCYFMMQVKMPTKIFGLAAIAFCIIYCAAASVLVYKFAPKTFRIRT
ncbi:MAG: hypothetical protein ACI4IW_03140 [Oscillospiraceae bacterium]